MFTQAKCTSCGANVSVDSTRPNSFCSYCGASISTQAAISNFNTVNNTTVVHNHYHANRPMPGQHRIPAKPPTGAAAIIFGFLLFPFLIISIPLFIVGASQASRRAAWNRQYGQK